MPDHAKIRELTGEIEGLRRDIAAFDPNVEDYAERFDNLLDEMGDVEIGDLSYSPSHVLRLVDPTAYRSGLLDYVDGMEREEFPDLVEMEDNLEELESELEDLEEED